MEFGEKFDAVIKCRKFNNLNQIIMSFSKLYNLKNISTSCLY